MAVEIKVPSVGESITEGILSRWLKKDGDAVRSGEPLFELETDKATQEVPSPADGVLSIGVKEGERVAIGSVIGGIDPQAKPKPRKTDNEPAVPKAAQRETVLSPAARQMVADAGVDIRQLHGSGREGRITKEDVLTYLSATGDRPSAIGQEAASAPSPAPKPRELKGEGPTADSRQPIAEARETRERMSGIRQRIAARLVEAQQTAAILTTFNEIDLSAVLALRAKYKEAFLKKHDVSLGLMGFFVKACVEALRAFPVVNARIDGSDIIYHHYYDLGVAVSTDKGLMVPVVRDTDRKSFAQIEKDIAALAQKAREGKITVNDLQGGTFTITNGGVFGSLLSTPIVNPPQSAILGMHTIQKRPVAVDEQVVIRPMMYVALSYDHRLIDGREAVRFLVRIKECIEAPERILLEM
ncbi:MAG: 2-oxoglutarate dehydrogenase complex dihydrolipoyllysine-residue succinyltransferase [Planctomycetes bacterium]|nr:2-oxoglutarate dehydrogenase complex dihydrolipoyllysine-residue succinyltransferase [Planctomycetota bacterium]